MKFLPSFLFLALAGGSTLLAAETAPSVRAEFVDSASPEVAAIRQAGEAATAKVAARLVGELTLALGAGGPENAVDFCHLNAAQLTFDAAKDGPHVVAVKRTSDRLRNPANAPDAAEQLAITKIQQARAAGEPLPTILVQRVQPEGASVAPEWRVYRSIIAQPACLACHGSPAAQPASLRAALRERYPHDAALGYQTGDWRGFVIAVVQPATSAKTK